MSYVLLHTSSISDYESADFTSYRSEYPEYFSEDLENSGETFFSFGVPIITKRISVLDNNKKIELIDIGDDINKQRKFNKFVNQFDFLEIIGEDQGSQSEEYNFYREEGKDLFYTNFFPQEPKTINNIDSFTGAVGGISYIDNPPKTFSVRFQGAQ